MPVKGPVDPSCWTTHLVLWIFLAPYFLAPAIKKTSLMNNDSEDTRGCGPKMYIECD